MEGIYNPSTAGAWRTFSSPGGWADALYKRAAKTTEMKQPGFYVFYYKDTGEYLTHNLELSEHGLAKCTKGLGHHR